MNVVITNSQVILFSLTLSNALVQNCGLPLKQEICSRPYLQALLKLLNNSSTHITVRNRILDFIQTWAKDFNGNPSLDYMQEVYNQLRNEGHSFPSDQPPSPKKKSYVDKQKEEEELQLAVINILYSWRYLYRSSSLLNKSKKLHRKCYLV